MQTNDTYAVPLSRRALLLLVIVVLPVAAFLSLVHAPKAGSQATITTTTAMGFR